MTKLSYFFQFCLYLFLGVFNVFDTRLHMLDIEMLCIDIEMLCAVQGQESIPGTLGTHSRNTLWIPSITCHHKNVLFWQGIVKYKIAQ